jgi:hypothetical protein
VFDFVQPTGTERGAHRQGGLARNNEPARPALPCGAGLLGLQDMDEDEDKIFFGSESVCD